MKPANLGLGSPSLLATNACTMLWKMSAITMTMKAMITVVKSACALSSMWSLRCFRVLRAGHQRPGQLEFLCECGYPAVSARFGYLIQHAADLGSGEQSQSYHIASAQPSGRRLPLQAVKPAGEGWFGGSQEPP